MAAAPDITQAAAEADEAPPEPGGRPHRSGNGFGACPHTGAKPSLAKAVCMRTVTDRVIGCNPKPPRAKAVCIPTLSYLLVFD